jgi:integrase
MSEKQVRNNPDLPKYVPQGRDGSYDWARKDQEKRVSELKRKFGIALERAKDILKSRPVSITEAKGNLYLQFSTQIQYDGTIGQTIRNKYSVAQYLGISKCADSPEAVNSALEVALKVAKEMESGTFSWDNYICWIRGELPEHLKQQVARQKTCKELVEEFKAHYWATHDFSAEESKYKSEKAWTNYYKAIYSKLPEDKPLNTEAVKQVLKRYDPTKTTYKRAVAALKSLCEHHSIKINFEQFKFNGEVTIKKGQELSNQEIIDGWKAIKYFVGANGRVNLYRDLYAWMLGMMAVYGLRNHETLNIQNLTEPFKLPNSDIVLPAFNDPNNKEKVIYTHGKTGKRLQPFPNPYEWIELFDLENVPEIPKFESLKQKGNFITNFVKNCTGDKVSGVPRKITFTPYDLRHTYAMRCRRLGLNPLDAKDYMGHSLEMHEKVYNKGIKAESLIASAQKYQEIAKEKPELSEVDKLKLENELLRQKLKELGHG